MEDERPLGEGVGEEVVRGAGICEPVSPAWPITSPPTPAQDLSSEHIPYPPSPELHESRPVGSTYGALLETLPLEQEDGSMHSTVLEAPWAHTFPFGGLL